MDNYILPLIPDCKIYTTRLQIVPQVKKVFAQLWQGVFLFWLIRIASCYGFQHIMTSEKGVYYFRIEMLA